MLLTVSVVGVTVVCSMCWQTHFFSLNCRGWEDSLRGAARGHLTEEGKVKSSNSPLHRRPWYLGVKETNLRKWGQMGSQARALSVAWSCLSLFCSVRCFWVGKSLKPGRTWRSGLSYRFCWLYLSVEWLCAEGWLWTGTQWGSVRLSYLIQTDSSSVPGRSLLELPSGEAGLWE